METIYAEFGDIGAPSIYQVTLEIYESNNE